MRPSQVTFSCDYSLAYSAPENTTVLDMRLLLHCIRTLFVLYAFILSLTYMTGIDGR